MEEIFAKNIKALRRQNSNLAEELESIAELKQYEVFQSGESPTDLNIYDHEKKCFIYNEPKLDLIEQLSSLQQCKNYKYLYFFGIGNGFLLLSLLLNHKAKMIYIIEPEYELFYIALHLHDFSDALYSTRLQLLHSSMLDFSIACDVLSKGDTLIHAGYLSLIQSAYYINYQEVSSEVKATLLEAKEFLSAQKGNNFSDSIKGITQSLQNISYLSKSAPLSQLKNTLQGKEAIVVSTGPSLNKQLKLLNQVKDHVTIISVDASLPILYTHNIKPDFVVSMERDEPTSKFFINIPQKFQEGIHFVCASLQDKTVFEAIKVPTRMTVYRPLAEYKYFQLDDFGYIGHGASAANMAHDLAYELGCSKVTLIGQDLSFNKEGETHTKGHIFETNSLIEKEKQENRLIKIPAYAGKGTVLTHIYWLAFKQALEHEIFFYQHKMQTINATEGGARIEGSIELSFQEVCNSLLQLEKKVPVTTILPSQKVQKNIESQFETKKRKLIKEGNKILSKINQVNNKLNIFKPSNSLKKNIDLYNDIISLRASTYNNNEFKTFFTNLIMPTIFQYEINIAITSSQYNENQNEYICNIIEKNKILWKDIAIHTKTILEVLQSN